jgi:hypothetical protein
MKEVFSILTIILYLLFVSVLCSYIAYKVQKALAGKNESKFFAIIVAFILSIITPLGTVFLQNFFVRGEDFLKVLVFSFYSLATVGILQIILIIVQAVKLFKKNTNPKLNKPDL